MFHQSTDINRVPIKSRTTVMDAQKYDCEFCDKEWESESEVVLHKVAHSKKVSKLIKEGSHVCFTCIRTYKSKEELCRHIRTMHLLSADTAARVEREIFICNKCERVFFNKRMFIIHFANSHKIKIDSNEIYCPKCLKVYSVKKLKLHFYTHLMQSILSCPICYQKCSNATDFQNHITDMHPKYFYCNICDYSGSTMEIFNKHCEQHHSVSPENIVPFVKHNREYVSKFFVPTDCENWKYCTPTPYRGLRLQRDVKICILCREICQTIEDMTEHLLQHTNVYKPVPKKTTFECECGKQFNYKILLKQHQTKCKRTKDINDTEASAETYILPQALPITLRPGTTLTPLNNEQNDTKDIEDDSGQVEIVEIHDLTE